MNDPIWIIGDATQEKFLRKKTEPFDFEKNSKEDIRQLVNRMRKAMHEANGIGLSANQIGIPYQVFVGQLPPSEKLGGKFYAVFNPKLEKTESGKIASEEGCLSVPGIYGEVSRPEKIVISGQDRTGKKIKIKAWGLLARMFQHEIDHLNGTLFIDKAKNLHEVPTSERLAKKYGNGER